MLQLAASKAETAYTGTSCGYACPPAQSCTSVYTRIADEQLLSRFATVYADLVVCKVWRGNYVHSLLSSFAPFYAVLEIALTSVGR